MEVALTPEQEAFLQERVSVGRFSTAEAAVQEALSLLQDSEHRRELRADLEEARRSVASGEGRAITPASMRAVVDEVARRGRARLEGETFGH